MSPGSGTAGDTSTDRGWAGSPLRTGLVLVTFVAFLALAWIASATLLLIFAGVLFGVFLDGLTRVLGSVLPLPRALRLAVICLLFAGLVFGFSGLGGAKLVTEARQLGETVQSQTGTIRDWLKERGLDLHTSEPAKEGKGEGQGESEKAQDTLGRKTDGLAGLASGALKVPNSLLSDAQNVLGPAVAVVLGLIDALGNVLVIAFFGVAFVADPGTYRNGILHFVPPRRRARAGQVLDEMGETLRHWLFGQLATMSVIFACVWIGLTLLGVGGALILGLQAGLLSFVPTVGPLVAGIVLLLASLASGWQVMLGTLGLYLAVQSLESYILTPLIQQRAIAMPPATIFAGQILLGVLFGLWGIGLALPLMAVVKVMLDRLYVEDGLGARS